MSHCVRYFVTFALSSFFHGAPCFFSPVALSGRRGHSIQQYDSTVPHRTETVGGVLLSAEALMSQSQRDLVDGLQHLRVGLPQNAHQAWLWASDQASLNGTAFHLDYCSLRWWTEQIYKHDKDNLRDQSSGRDCARLACLSANSLAWLNACPTAALGLRLQPSEFSVLNKLYLGEPVLPQSVTLNCELCADSMDAYGDHLLCCRKSGFIQRHQTVAKQLWHMCTAAGFNATCEVSVSGRSRPADILLPHWQGGGPCAIDVSIVHPLAPSTSCHAVKTGREAVEAMERVKHSKYDQCCNESNVTLIPFVLSTFGLLGAEAERFFHGVTAAARRRAVVDDIILERTQYLQQTLISLNREIARQLLQGPLDTAAEAPTYGVDPSAFSLMFGDMPIGRNVSLTAQGIQERSVIVLRQFREGDLKEKAK